MDKITLGAIIGGLFLIFKIVENVIKRRNDKEIIEKLDQIKDLIHGLDKGVEVLKEKLK